MTTKVLFVDQTAQLGGAELWLKDVVLARQAGDSVYLFQDGPLADVLRSANVEVECFEAAQSLARLRKDSGLWVKLRSSGAVLRMVREVACAARQADVIYANTPKALIVAALAGIRARRPVVYHLHDILSRDHFSCSNLTLLVGVSNRLVSHVVANSEATLLAYRQAGGTNKCSISYNGFDPAAFEPYIDQQPTCAEQVRMELGIEDEVPLVAVFGRLAPWKGQQLAIEALGQLPGYHLMLVGDALFGEQTYKTQLLSLASQHSVAGRVHFMGFRREVLPLMQAADVIVHCSLAPEPFGRVIVEAMLSRRPIIAARAGGAQEIVTDSVDGFLFEPGDKGALAACIAHVNCLPADKRAVVLDQAHSSAAKRFSLAKAVADVEQVIAQVTAV